MITSGFWLCLSKVKNSLSDSRLAAGVGGGGHFGTCLNRKKKELFYVSLRKEYLTQFDLYWLKK